jgi:hypothetical protein
MKIRGRAEMGDPFPSAAEFGRFRRGPFRVRGIDACPHRSAQSRPFAMRISCRNCHQVARGRPGKGIPRKVAFRRRQPDSVDPAGFGGTSQGRFFWGVLPSKGTYPVSTARCVWKSKGLRRMGGVGGVGWAGKAADICDVSDWPLPEGKHENVGGRGQARGRCVGPQGVKGEG